MNICGTVNKMNKRTSRRYHSPHRANQAEATKQSIMLAARKVFIANGYQAATIQMIAREANVAVSTLYAVFGSKAAILSAVIKSAGADEDIRSIAQAAMEEAEPRRQLYLATRVIRSIHERETDIEDLLWQAGGGDPDLAAAWRQSHRQQLNRIGELMKRLSGKEALKPGLDVQMAIEIYWALSSPEVYRLLVRERGWSPQQYEDRLGGAAIQLLLNE